MTESTPSYTQGHHSSVVASHASRTAEADAAFLLPHLQPFFHLLDVGCGPGTITAGLAAHLPDGEVIGVDVSEEVVRDARLRATELKVFNLKFEQGDVLAGLPFPSDSFDVIWFHQTICHLPRPIDGLKEAYRVLKPGGLLAAREADMVSCQTSPDPDGGLKLWTNGLAKMLKHTGATPDCGRKLESLAEEAGFQREKMKFSEGRTVYEEKEKVKWWGKLHVERLEKSKVRDSMLAAGVTETELEEMISALKIWSHNGEGRFDLFQGELLSWK